MNTKFAFIQLSLFLLITSIPVLATSVKEKPLTYTTVKEKTLLEENHRRNLWSLSETDWTRYKTLMKGIRGSISPVNISPIEVLGTHARSDQERQKYAEIWARMRHDDITRILAFQKAYDAAFTKLYPNEKIINTQLLNLNQNNTFKPGDRVLVFLKINHCPECQQTIRTLMANDVVKDLQVDIYFIDTQNKTDDGKIRQWAEQHQIDKHRLQSGNITLNHDNGNLYRMTKKVMHSVPLVFSVNAKTIKQVDLIM